MSYNKHRLKAIKDIINVLPKIYRCRVKGYSWKSIGLILEKGL